MSDCDRILVASHLSPADWLPVVKDMAAATGHTEATVIADLGMALRRLRILHARYGVDAAEAVRQALVFVFAGSAGNPARTKRRRRA